MRVGIVADETVEQPLLGVVRSDLDAVDDRLLLQAHDLALAGLGQRHPRGERATAVLELGDRRLEEPQPAHRSLPASDLAERATLGRGHLAKGSTAADVSRTRRALSLSVLREHARTPRPRLMFLEPYGHLVLLPEHQRAPWLACVARFPRVDS